MKKREKKKNNTQNILTMYICKNNSRAIIFYTWFIDFTYIPEYLSIPRKHSISKKTSVLCNFYVNWISNETNEYHYL